MASENKNENIMLTGQTAYFKKSGSMENFGTVTLNTPNNYTEYGPGFIDENSSIKATELTKSQDYIATDASMQEYLGTDYYDGESEGYTVKDNAELIHNELSPHYEFFDTIGDSIKTYEYLDMLWLCGAKFDYPMILPINYSLQFKLDIEVDGTEGVVLTNEDDTFKIWKSTNSKLYINDTLIYDPIGKDHIVAITVHQHNGVIDVFVNNDLIVNDMTGYTTTLNITCFDGLTGGLYYLYVYDNNTNKKIYSLLPAINNKLNTIGFGNAVTGEYYPDPSGLCINAIPYDYCNLYLAFADTGVLPGPNTGIELKFSMDDTSEANRRILSCESLNSVSDTLSFGFGVNSSNVFMYTRNNNKYSWYSTGLAALSLVGADNPTVVTINKNNDGKITMTGAYTLDTALSGTATNTNTGKKTIWLGGMNDIMAYRPVEEMIANTDYKKFAADMWFWYLKVYEGDTLTHHFVPAQRGGIPVLLDLITHKTSIIYGTARYFTKLDS